MKEYEDLQRWYSLEDYENEQWKVIKGFENEYLISNYGRIKSKTRIFYCGKNHSSKKIIKEHILHVYFRKNKYVGVTLKKNGEHFSCEVHRLVAEAFIPNIEQKEQVNHKDGDKHNNKVENLEWFTRSENALHSYFKLGNIKYKRNFSEQEIKEIRKLYSQGCSKNQLARQYYCSRTAIKRLVENQSYQHVK